MIQLLQYPAQMIALLSSGLFAGAMVYINAVEQPRCLRNSNTGVAGFFKEDIRRSEVMLVRLAAITAVSAVLATVTGCGILWLVGGFVHGLTAVYLLTEVRRTHAALESLQSDRSAATAAPELLGRWTGHNTALTVTGLCVYFVFLLQI